MKNYVEQIDAYLDQELSAADLAAFEKALQSDTALQEEVRLHRLERAAILMMIEEEFKGKIKTWRDADKANSTDTTTAKVIDIKKTARKPQPQQVSWMRRLSIAASVLLLIGAGSWFWASQNYSNTALSKDYYLLADAGGDKGGSTTVEADVQKGLTAFFTEKDYAKAATAFAKIPTNSPQYIEARYYLAHSQFQQGQYSKATESYQYLLRQETLPAFMNRNKIEWNQLLAMLGNGQKNTAFYAKLDQLIQKGSPPFDQKAKDLKADLNRFWSRLF